MRGKDKLADELGDVLFVAANLARHMGVDPAQALTMTNAKFECRFRRMEALAAAEVRALEGLDLAAQDRRKGWRKFDFGFAWCERQAVSPWRRWPLSSAARKCCCWFRWAWA